MKMERNGTQGAETKIQGCIGKEFNLIVKPYLIMFFKWIFQMQLVFNSDFYPIMILNEFFKWYSIQIFKDSIQVWWYMNGFESVFSVRVYSKQWICKIQWIRRFWCILVICIYPLICEYLKYINFVGVYNYSLRFLIEYNPLNEDILQHTHTRTHIYIYKPPEL